MKIEKIENQLKKSNINEHIINLFKAAVATVPFAGGIASLISDYIPTRRQKRLEEFALSISKE